MTNEKKIAELSDRIAERTERCDTDGFVSNFCDGITLQKLIMEDKLAANGGNAEFPVLMYGDKVVCYYITMVKDKFSYSKKAVWILSDEMAEVFGRKFIPYGENSRVQKKMGFRQERMMLPAQVVTVGSGTGLSGLSTVRVVTVVDKKKVKEMYNV